MHYQKKINDFFSEGNNHGYEKLKVKYLNF